MKEGWLTEDGRTPEGAARARRLFEAHMPELVRAFDRLSGQLASPHARTLLVGRVRSLLSASSTVRRPPSAAPMR